MPLVKKFRIVRLTIGWDLSADAGGGSGSCIKTYAIPDDGRDIGELTLAELTAYPAATALALLDDVVSSRKERR